MGESVADYKDI